VPPDDVVSGVGIAVPGVVDGGARMVSAAAKYDWAMGQDLTAWGRAAFGVATVMENDARAALVGEMTFGAARDTADAVMMTFGTGIGVAALVDGVVLRGDRGHAGILGGHLTVDLDGPPCVCGNIGCAEAVASAWALRRDASDNPRLARALRGSPQSGLAALFDTREHPDVAATFARFVDAWVAAVVNAIHAFDPTVVIVAGGAMQSAALVLPAIEAATRARLWSSVRRPVFVVPRRPQHCVLLGLSALGAGIR
jgi:glucokinase